MAEVASVGNGVQQVVVEARPEQLRARSLAFSELLGTLRALLVSNRRASLDDLASAPIGVAGAGAPSARVGDVALVHVSDDMPTGVAEFGAGTPAVGGIVIARRDAQLTPLIEGVRRGLERERARLPAGVQLVTVYDRLQLVDRVGQTCTRRWPRKSASSCW